MVREYKDSGITWIGRIPQDWNTTKLGSLYTQRNEKVSDKDYAPLSVTMQGILPQLETAAKTDDGDNRKLVKKGDFAINSRSDRRGSCGISPYDGSVSLINTILKPRGEMNPNFYNWLFHTSPFADEFYKWGHGIVDDLWTTRWQEMKNISVVIPSLEEQQHIADYLDKKCAEIDGIIELQEQMIAQLTDYKQSVITEAVTKGINPDAQLVPSGIDWIGEIPNGWEIKKVKYIVDSISKGNGITKDEVFADGDTPCVRYGEIYSKYNQAFTECYSATKIELQNSPHYFNRGDILCAGTGELVEEIGKSIVYLGEKPCLAGGDIIVISHRQNPSFLNYALNCNYAQTQKSKGKAKLKVVHISAFEIGSIFMLLPSLEEQKVIADYLDNKCSEINSLITLKQQKIDALKEYKKSLIFECVTGKKEIN